MATIGLPYAEGGGKEAAGFTAGGSRPARRPWWRRARQPAAGAQLSEDERLRRKNRKFTVKKTVSYTLLGVFGYMAYAYCRVLAWTYVRGERHQQARAIAFVAVFASLTATAVFAVLRVNLFSPGLLPKNYKSATGLPTDAEDSFGGQTMVATVVPGTYLTHDPHGEKDTDPQAAAARGAPDSPGEAPGTAGTAGTADAAASDHTRVGTAHTADSASRASSDDATLPRTAALPEAFVCEYDGYSRWCSRCQSVKPDRVHHSAEIDRCVLKMDHYCQWVGALIGHGNYKFFYQFVVYTFLLMAFVCATTAYCTATYVRAHHAVNGHFVALLALSGIITFFLMPFAVMHTYYILVNITTIEYLARNSRIQLVNLAVDGRRYLVETDFGMRLYDRGMWRNWTDVMGPAVWDWVLPVTPSRGDGRSFAYGERALERLRAKVRAQQADATATEFRAH
ncbi:DHHC palmitoyltransferase-domain-containing protein [Dipodascopsis tothii]|uniref:DHHC palmitoyltransferase-domain-containing protein n=1 Tax=Dipodascopsis tothii TaxID=44089 RepID=UPI0034CFE5FE